MLARTSKLSKKLTHFCVCVCLYLCTICRFMNMGSVAMSTGNFTIQACRENLDQVRYRYEQNLDTFGKRYIGWL